MQSSRLEDYGDGEFYITIDSKKESLYLKLDFENNRVLLHNEDTDLYEADKVDFKELLKIDSFSNLFYCSHCHNTKIDETIEGGYSYIKECSCDIDHDLIDFYDKNK